MPSQAQGGAPHGAQGVGLGVARGWVSRWDAMHALTTYHSWPLLACLPVQEHAVKKLPTLLLFSGGKLVSAAACGAAPQPCCCASAAGPLCQNEMLVGAPRAALFPPLAAD